MAKCDSCEENPARTEHACPFQSEVYDDLETLCNCCDSCAAGCADGI
jgi:hypothetical protein